MPLHARPAQDLLVFRMRFYLKVSSERSIPEADLCTAALGLQHHPRSVSLPRKANFPAAYEGCETRPSFLRPCGMSWQACSPQSFPKPLYPALDRLHRLRMLVERSVLPPRYCVCMCSRCHDTSYGASHFWGPSTWTRSNVPSHFLIIRWDVEIQATHHMIRPQTRAKRHDAR